MTVVTFIARHVSLHGRAEMQRHNFRGANYPAWSKIRRNGVEWGNLERIAKSELDQFRREAE